MILSTGVYHGKRRVAFDKMRFANVAHPRLGMITKNEVSPSQAVLPRAVRRWTLTTLREKLIKIGAKVVRHSRQVIFQMAEVAIPRELFRTILERIAWLRLRIPLPG